MKAADTRDVALDIVTAQPPPQAVAMWWLGQASVVLRAAGTTVYIDPFLSEYPERLAPPPFTSLPDTFLKMQEEQKRREQEREAGIRGDQWSLASPLEQDGRQRKDEIVSRSRTKKPGSRRTISMNAFSPLCTVWHQQVKEFFSSLHGQQSKTLAMFVVGAIKAESIVVQRVAEGLLGESEAKAPSIERRLERFLSNPRIETAEVWDNFLAQILPYFTQQPLRLVIDLTAYEEHAQVIYLGLLQHSRVLPLVWKVMPGQEKWDQGLWECVGELFKRVAPHIGETECTIIGDSAFGCFAMVSLCVKYGWH